MKILCYLSGLRYAIAISIAGFIRFVAFVCFLPVALQAQVSHNVGLLDQWKTTGLPVAPDGSVYNDVWGFSVNGRDYAAMGSTNGTHILEITAEGTIEERDFVPGSAQGPNLINRDVFEYNGYLYTICDQGFSSMQIIDLHFLPDSVFLVYDNDSLIQRAHSIFIDSATAKMYICGPNSSINGDRPLDVFSLSDPIAPQYLGSFTAVMYVHDAFVRNDTAWLNCGDEGLYVVNFSNVAFPQILGSLDMYPDLGYNHSGWLSENAQRYVFTDETQGKQVKYCDVSDPNDIQILSLFNSGSTALTIAHNPMLFNNYVFLSHYFDGLQIFDVSDGAQPVRVGWYDTHLQNENLFSGAWGIFVYPNSNRILISDREEGLFLFYFHPPPRVTFQNQEHGIFPNPANDEAWFWYSNTRKFSYKILIYDVSGKKVHENNFSDASDYFFDVSQWPEGTYFYRVLGINFDIELKGKFVVAR